MATLTHVRNPIATASVIASLCVVSPAPAITPTPPHEQPQHEIARIRSHSLRAVLVKATRARTDGLMPGVDVPKLLATGQVVLHDNERVLQPTLIAQLLAGVAHDDQPQPRHPRITDAVVNNAVRMAVNGAVSSLLAAPRMQSAELAARVEAAKFAPSERTMPERYEAAFGAKGFHLAQLEIILSMLRNGRLFFREQHEVPSAGPGLTFTESTNQHCLAQLARVDGDMRGALQDLLTVLAEMSKRTLRDFRTWHREGKGPPFELAGGNTNAGITETVIDSHGQLVDFSEQHWADYATTHQTYIESLGELEPQIGTVFSTASAKAITRHSGALWTEISREARLTDDTIFPDAPHPHSEFDAVRDAAQAATSPVRVIAHPQLRSTLQKVTEVVDKGAISLFDLERFRKTLRIRFIKDGPEACDVSPAQAIALLTGGVEACGYRPATDPLMFKDPVLNQAVRAAVDRQVEKLLTAKPFDVSQIDAKRVSKVAMTQKMPVTEVEKGLGPLIASHRELILALRAFHRGYFLRGPSEERFALAPATEVGIRERLTDARTAARIEEALRAMVDFHVTIESEALGALEELARTPKAVRRILLQSVGEEVHASIPTNPGDVIKISQDNRRLFNENWFEHALGVWRALTPFAGAPILSPEAESRMSRRVATGQEKIAAHAERADAAFFQVSRDRRISSLWVVVPWVVLTAATWSAQATRLTEFSDAKLTKMVARRSRWLSRGRTLRDPNRFLAGLLPRVAGHARQRFGDDVVVTEPGFNEIIATLYRRCSRRLTYADQHAQKEAKRKSRSNAIDRASQSSLAAVRGPQRDASLWTLALTQSLRSAGFLQHPEDAQPRLDAAVDRRIQRMLWRHRHTLVRSLRRVAHEMLFNAESAVSKTLDWQGLRWGVRYEGVYENAATTSVPERRERLETLLRDTEATVADAHQMQAERVGAQFALALEIRTFLEGISDDYLDGAPDPWLPERVRDWFSGFFADVGDMRSTLTKKSASAKRWRDKIAVSLSSLE